MKKIVTGSRTGAGVQYRSASGVGAAEQEYRVEGYATTFGEEYTLYEDWDLRIVECVDAGAFGKCDMEDTVFQYDHCGRVFARVSNGTLKLETDGHGLKVSADLSGTEEGRKLYDEIKGGYTTRMSFGFVISGESWTTRKGADGKTERVRTITGVGRLYDVSAVSIPANDGTEISARKLFEEQRGILEAERNAQDMETRKMEAARLDAKYRLMQTEQEFEA